MNNKEKILKINKSIRRASALTKKAIEAGDEYKSDEITLLLEQIQELKEMLTARLEKEEARLAQSS